MLVVLPFSHLDCKRAQKLLEWIAELDPRLPQHKALLVGSSQVSPEDIKQTLVLAKKVFGQATAIRQREVEERGRPYSQNRMFILAANMVKAQFLEPFLWLEPDVVPLCPGWLDAMESEYRRSGKPFMGFIYKWVNEQKRCPHITGNAIYPADIAQYNPSILLAEDESWDVVRPEVTIKYAHETKLIYHDWAKRNPQKCHSFRSMKDVRRIIPKHAVLFHSSKYGDLIERLREKKNGIETPTDAELLWRQARRKLRGWLRGGSSYYHSGNLGDVVYALKAIKLHGGGDLYIGPRQRLTSPCAVPISREQFDLFLPLLSKQEYLGRVEFRTDYPVGDVAYDLNEFRNHWNNWEMRTQENIHNLCEMHCYTLGVRHQMKANDCWLDPGEPIWTGKVIVHRSQRYQAEDFPWAELVKRHASRLLFVGLEGEHQEFERLFGRVAYYKVVDLLEMSRLIAGSSCFVGNQSFPCSLALAMGHRVYQETWSPSADCVFPGPNFMNQQSPIEEFERWLP